MPLPLSPDALGRAFLYLRKSRDRQERADPDVLRRHRRALLDVAARDGVLIPAAQQYEEIGSGETIAGRPGFCRLLEGWRLLPAGSGGIVYVMDVDRLSRGILTERGQVQDLLLSRCLLIRTPHELIDLRQPAQGLLYEIKGSLARHELLIYKARVAATRRDQIRRGEIRNGRVAMGYTWDRNTSLPVPDGRFPLLQSLCRDALRLSVGRLAEKYGLSRATVYTNLTNPMICGWPAKRHAVDPETGIRHNLPREQWIWPEQPGDYPVACTRAEWEAIQVALIDRREADLTTVGQDGWCRDVMRFVGREERRCRLGVQDHHPTYELPESPLLYIRREPVHAAVQDAILRLLGDRDAVSRAIRLYHLVQSSESRRIASSGDIAALQREAALREEELARLLRRELTADIADLASVRAVRREIKAELATIRGEIRALTGAVPATAETDALLTLLEGTAPELWQSIWIEDLDEETRRAITRGLIARVPVTIESAGKWKHKRREVLPVEWRPWINPGL